MEALTGIDRSEVLGDDDTAKFFRDDRTQTLANAVIEHPRRADEEFGAERSGRNRPGRRSLTRLTHSGANSSPILIAMAATIGIVRLSSMT